MSRLKSKAQQSHRSKLPSTNTKDRIPWSKQVAKKDAKEKRRTQKARKRVLMASASLCEERSALKRMRADSEEKRDDSVESEDDWALLAEEERLAKKLKKGKITQAEFDTATFSGL
jgi:ATP-dependent RNA helicase DDX55/SPB4